MLSHSRTGTTTNFIADGSGVSGGTFHAILELMVLSDMDGAILENVKGLQGQPLDDALEQLAECGYTTSWHLQSADNFFFPQRRPRIYLIAIKTALMMQQGSVLCWHWGDGHLVVDRSSACTSHNSTG